MDSIDSKQNTIFKARLGREHPKRQENRLSKKFEDLDMFDLFDFAIDSMISNRDVLNQKIDELEKRIELLEGKKRKDDDKFDERGIRNRKSL